MSATRMKVHEGADCVSDMQETVFVNTNNLPDESGYFSMEFGGPEVMKSECGGDAEEDRQPYESSITTQDECMAVEALRQLAQLHTAPLPSREFCPEPAKVPHACGQCGERFECKTDLDNHEVCHQVKRPHSCRTCGNLFRTKTDLQEHAKSHRVIRNYSCARCEVSFRRPSSLANHMKRHSYPPPESKTPLGTLRLNDNNNIVPPFGTLRINKKYQAIPHAPNYYQEKVLSGDEVPTDPFLIKQIIHMPDEMCDDKSCIVKVAPPRRPKKAGVARVGRSVRANGSEAKATEGRNRPNVCRHCDKSFSRSTTLTSHMKLHEECNKCRKKFTDPDVLRDHRLGCLAKAPVMAAIHALLSRGGPVPKNPRHIIPPALSKGKYMCVYCTKSFVTNQKLYRHMWIHRKKVHACLICGNTFANVSLLDGHIREQHSGENAFKCKTCDQTFSSRQVLCTHEHGVHGTSVFWCQICEKMFTSHTGYVIHARIHSGERPCGCRFCPKTFRDTGTLHKHERIHTGERPHACPLCHRAFNQKVALREHVRWVHAIKRKTQNGTFSCQLCRKTFADHEELCAHLIQHSDKIAGIAKGIVKKELAAKSSAATASSAKSKRKRKRQKKAVKKGKIVPTRCPLPDTKSFQVKTRNTTRFPAGQTYPHTFYPPSQSNVKNNQCDMCGAVFFNRDTLLLHVSIHI